GRAGRVSVVRPRNRWSQGGVADMDSATGDDAAPARDTAVRQWHARRARQSARRPRALYLQGRSRHALPATRHDGELVDRTGRLERLRASAESRRHRPASTLPGGDADRRARLAFGTRTGPQALLL